MRPQMFGLQHWSSGPALGDELQRLRLEALNQSR
jgi:hypothetical protein